MTAQRPHLVLIGPPGAGKSVLGRQVAALIGVPFVDTDVRIEAKHGPIAAIFRDHGEETFRAAEREAVAAALGERAVVALGGGAILNSDTQADLADTRVALVMVTPEQVESRIRNSARPLLKEGLDAWKQLVDQRMSIYERLATRIVDTSDRSEKSLAFELAEWVREEDKV